MSSPETQPKGPEANVETPRVSQEQYESLVNPETAAELSVENGEKAAEKARVEALETAVSVERGGSEKARKEPSIAARRKTAISKQERSASFKKHMKDAQAEMSLPERTFSKVIHNKAVEKTSEFVGSTIARPNAILAGGLMAFILVAAVYFLSKSLGYVLSGFETIGAFIIGWVLGILYDYLRVVITGKKS